MTQEIIGSEKEYFSHDYGTRHKKKMSALVHEHKMKGYGLFWVIVEMLHEDSTLWLDLDDVTFISIHKQSGEPVTYIKKFVTDCITRYKVFIQEGERFTTDRVLRNIAKRLEISAKKSEAGQKGAEKRWHKLAPAITGIAPAIECHSEPMAKDSKEKESKVKESKSIIRPKGLTAAFAADASEVKEMKKEYNSLVESLSDKDTTECWLQVKTFIQAKKPVFVEPYIDLWNIFGLKNGIIKEPVRVTKNRRKKIETRTREEGFDFVAVLQIIKNSDFLKGKKTDWKVDIDFILESEQNYTKILEGKYND